MMIRLLITLLIVLVAIPVTAQDPTPTGNPNDLQIPLPVEDIFNSLEEGQESLEEISTEPLTGPNGIVLLPDLTDITIVFAYAKWLLSPEGAEGMFGPFSGVFIHLSFFVAMNMTMIAIYAILYAATYAIAWGVWLFRMMLTIINTIANVVSIIGNGIGGILGTIFKFLGG